MIPRICASPVPGAWEWVAKRVALDAAAPHSGRVNAYDLIKQLAEFLACLGRLDGLGHWFALAHFTSDLVDVVCTK
jgi:hypothetical protein